MSDRHPIPGWAGYFVCAEGHVYNRRGLQLSPSVNKRTHHLRVRLYGPDGNRRGTKGGTYRNIYVHQLICLVFNGECPSDACLVRHMDGDPQNNVPDNLVWGTALENSGDYWADEEAVHKREERKGLRGTHPLHETDMFLGF